MSNFYAIYATSEAPRALLDKYPYHAEYLGGGISLFVETLEQVTGVANPEVIDIASMQFNHPFTDDAQGLTAEQLTQMINSYVDLVSSGEATGAEVQLSKIQGRYLYETTFKSVEVLGGLSE